MEQDLKKLHTNPLGHEPIGKLLMIFALPSVVSMLVNSVYNIVDQIFIGRGVGVLGNAATTVAYPLVTIVLAVSTLLGAGGGSYAAIKMGEKNEKEAEKTLGTVFTLLVVIGLLFAVFGIAFIDPILRVFGATDNTMEYSRQYAFVMLLGTPFNMLSVGLAALARTDGAPKLSMYSMIAGAILNTILDPIYIFVFHWGVTGAAIATITSQIISALILIHYFIKKSNMRLKLAYLKPKLRIAGKTFALGMSSGITQAAATVLQVVMNNTLIFYGNMSTVGGDVALSAMGIVMKVSMILVSICIGIGIGAQPILGYNRGAGQYGRIKKTYVSAVGIGTVVAVLGWLACVLMPHVLLSVFGSDSDTFAAFAVKAMRVFNMGIFCCGFQVISTNYFQATGQPVKASILSMLRQIILLIPLILILPNYFGLDGILYAGAIADIGSAAIVGIFILVEMKRLSGLVRKEKREMSVAEAVSIS